MRSRIPEAQTANGQLPTLSRNSQVLNPNRGSRTANRDFNYTPPMAQVARSTEVHDVVIIGSGAGGGTVTKVLADLGISVVLLEAGPMLAITDLKEHMWPYNVPH